MTVRLVLAAALLAVAGAVSAQTAARQTYIVQLGDAPAATYAGGSGTLAATRPAVGAKFDAQAPNVRAYVDYLNVRRSAALAAVPGAAVLHRYALAFNGFAARLTEAEAKSLMTRGGVVSVTLSQGHRKDTTRTPAFLGLSAPGGLWSQVDALARAVKGEDIVIGVLDSGVTPEDASFGDRQDAAGKPVDYTRPGTPVYGPPPAKWKGACQTGPGFTAAMCNNKLVGARFFLDDFAANATLAPLEYASPRDADGHGTHTASTAGGNADVDAVIDGVPVGTMSGVAPRARIATYKVCWESTDPEATGCAYDGDILAAIDAAIADGVDVINYSISGTQTNFADPVELAYFNAAAAGVFVAASAGNSGPANTVAHPSPWLATVAASTHDRYTVSAVALGSGASFSGPSYQNGLPAKPLIRSQDAGVLPFASLSSADQTALLRCYNDADRAAAPPLGGSPSSRLDPAKVAGKIVECIRGGNVLINKGDAVRAAGGAGMIIQNAPGTNNSVVLQPYVVPTVHLTVSAYATVDAYAATAGATAAFGPGVQQTGVVAPVMADFSSRGPSRANLDILKPDVTAPGVDVIAAFKDNTLTQAQHDAVVAGTYTSLANATSLQGTSMSSPHVAGVAALLKQGHPTWSPSAIKSAIMTTTTAVRLASGAVDTDRWGYGAGHVNPNGATDPGLVYDAGPADYGRFLCGLALTPPAGSGSCALLGTTPASNLNLASLTAANVVGAQTLQRRVTNVGPAVATYAASTRLPGFDVSVVPATLTLAPGASASFSVALTKTTATVGSWSFGSLTWSDGVHQVVSPLTARALGFAAVAEVSDNRATGTKVFSVVSAYDGPMAVTPTGLLAATLSSGNVARDATQCFDFAVPAGTPLVRFQLFDADTQGGTATDLDLTVYAGAGGTGSVVGSSGSSTSNEVVTLLRPTTSTLSACVTGYGIAPSNAGSRATYALSSWIVGPSVGAPSLRAVGPSQVYLGAAASVGLRWSVAAGKRYLGSVRFADPTGASLGSTVVSIDAR